jgi:hypothetical protein
MDILLCEWIFELQYCLSVWHNECCDLGTLAPELYLYGYFVVELLHFSRSF